METHADCRRVACVWGVAVRSCGRRAVWVSAPLSPDHDLHLSAGWPWAAQCPRARAVRPDGDRALQGRRKHWGFPGPGGSVLPRPELGSSTDSNGAMALRGLCHHRGDGHHPCPCPGVWGRRLGSSPGPLLVSSSEPCFPVQVLPPRALLAPAPGLGHSGLTHPDLPGALCWPGAGPGGPPAGMGGWCDGGP